MPFIFHNCKIPGLMVVEPKVFHDERGFFMETYKDTDFIKAGIKYSFLQDNHSLSSKGTLRGLHFQEEPYAQGKLVRIISGRAWDVAVDLRKNSNSFGKWYGLEISVHNRLMFWIPPGFAHGFLALEDDTELIYKCTKEYNSISDKGLRWNDPDLAIEWPIKDVKLSEKDANLPLLKDILVK